MACTRSRLVINSDDAFRRGRVLRGPEKYVPRVAGRLFIRVWYALIYQSLGPRRTVFLKYRALKTFIFLIGEEIGSGLEGTFIFTALDLLSRDYGNIGGGDGFWVEEVMDGGCLEGLRCNRVF